MASKVEQVMNLACCSKEVAEKALVDANNDVVGAVDKLMDTPKAKGDKYVRPPPTIDDGLTEEVRNKIKQVRELSEALNAGRLASETTKMQAGSSVEILQPRTADEQAVVAQLPSVPTSGPSKEGSPAESS